MPMQAPNPQSPPHPAVSDPLGLAARLLYRDAMMLIVDKPAGLPVHKGPGGGPNLADNLGALRFGLPRDPELAHRLDKETSGCLVLGRHRKALVRLADLFKANQVDKTYWAVVEGSPAAEAGTIDLAMAPRDPKRGWWMKIDPAGQPAVTRFEVLGRAGGLTWLALEPVTGRTHQLRLHCQASGYPILGDPIYGSAPRRGGPGLHLMARTIAIPFDRKKPPVTATAAVPDHMQRALAACGWARD